MYDTTGFRCHSHSRPSFIILVNFQDFMKILQ